ncbi:MAG: hypothetical protein ACRETA_09740 [Gammaproteobacteria bacterium]
MASATFSKHSAQATAFVAGLIASAVLARNWIKTGSFFRSDPSTAAPVTAAPGIQDAEQSPYPAELYDYLRGLRQHPNPLLSHYGRNLTAQYLKGIQNGSH